MYKFITNVITMLYSSVLIIVMTVAPVFLAQEYIFGMAVNVDFFVNAFLIAFGILILAIIPVTEYFVKITTKRCDGYNIRSASATIVTAIYCFLIMCTITFNDIPLHAFMILYICLSQLHTWVFNCVADQNPVALAAEVEYEFRKLVETVSTKYNIDYNQANLLVKERLEDYMRKYNEN